MVMHIKTKVQYCCRSVAKSCPTLCSPMDCNTPGFPVLHHFREFAHTYFHWVDDAINHLILSCPLLLLSVFSSFRVFSNESAFCIRWPKYWRFSISLSPSSEYSGLISFSVDWFDLPAIQGTLKSLFWNHTSKSSFLQHSAFFMVQHSHLYMTAGKTIALTIPTFVILAK